MNDATRKELVNEAVRKLNAYLATGLAGFWQQAIDRLAAVGIDCGKVGPGDAKLVLEFLGVNGWMS